jgi:DNA replication and repair protein RecF
LEGVWVKRRGALYEAPINFMVNGDLAALNIRLYQFRCHRELRLSLSPGRHFLLGRNGQGKTSILEAVYFVSRLRSFRTSHLRELTAWNEKQFRIEAAFAGDSVAVTWSSAGRELELNGQPATQLSDFWGRLTTVLFIGEDRLLVTGAGSLRRNWVDGLIAQRDPAYLGHVQRYRRILRQRNAWLQQQNPSAEMGEGLTQQLTESGLLITAARRELTQLLAGAAGKRFTELSDPDEIFTIQYQPSFIDKPDWTKIKSSEERQRVTLLGPHRDDWNIQISEHSLAKFGSEGQQRTAALALRLAEAQLIREKRGGWPIFLMDDVAPQLDECRQERLKNLLPGDATILFTAPEGRGWIRPRDQAWEISPGSALKL